MGDWKGTSTAREEAKTSLGKTRTSLPIGAGLRQRSEQIKERRQTIDEVPKTSQNVRKLFKSVGEQLFDTYISTNFVKPTASSAESRNSTTYKQFASVMVLPQLP